MRDQLNAVISRNLVRIRCNLRYSQDNIATALEIKQPSYARMESGRTRISADQLGMLALFYKIPVHLFFSDTSFPHLSPDGTPTWFTERATDSGRML